MKAAIEQDMVLCFGMPRSGTTWIGKLLDSHRDTYYLHEPDTVFPRNDLPLICKSSEALEYQGEAAAWLEDILTRQHQKVTAFPPIFPKNYMSPAQRLLLKSSTLASRLDGKLGSPLGLVPLRRVSDNANALLVWKSIESMGRIGLIMSVCPNARAIHLMRHPCGHVNSTLQGFESGKFSTEAPIYEDWDLFHKLIAQSGDSGIDMNDVKAMAPEERLAFRWGVLNDHCLHSVEPGKHLLLRYEAVCEDPLAEVTRVFDWLGITLGEQTRQFIEASTSADKDSYYGTTKNPLKSAYSWQKKLSENQINNILSMVSRFETGKYYCSSESVGDVAQ